MNDSLISVYIDTSAITQMGDNGFWRLLAASDAEKLNIFISEVVIWEKSKARHRLDEASLFYSEDKGIPLNAASFQKTLQEFGVKIIKHNDRITKKAEEFIENEQANFDISDSNELRDAHILATAFCELDKNTIIASNDGGFIRRMPILLPDFSPISREEIKRFVDAEGSRKPVRNPCDFQSLTVEEIKSPFSRSLLSVLPIIDPEDFGKYESDLENIDLNKVSSGIIGSEPEPIPNEFGKLETLLSKLHLVDTEIKKRVLGYTQWFSDPPLSKNDLYQLVESEGYGKEVIENNAQRLKQENLLIETENYWLTNTQNAEAVEICEQAMAAVMPEIIELMELS